MHEAFAECPYSKKRLSSIQSSAGLTRETLLEGSQGCDKIHKRLPVIEIFHSGILLELAPKFEKREK